MSLLSYIFNLSYKTRTFKDYDYKLVYPIPPLARGTRYQWEEMLVPCAVLSLGSQVTLVTQSELALRLSAS